MRVRGRASAGMVCLWFACCLAPCQAGDLSSPLTGLWQGKLKVTGTATLRLVFEFVPRPDGTVTGYLHSLDQSAYDLRLDEVKLTPPNLHLTLRAVGGTFDGKLSEDGKSLTGQWQQGAINLPLSVEHTDSAPELLRPQTPRPPFPYHDEAVSYPSSDPAIALAGTLSLPPGGGPFPAIMLVPDSMEPTDRNGRANGHRPLLVLADYLARQGFGVLRYDMRGVGGSGGKTGGTLEENAADALAGVAFLKTRPQIDASRLGLLGHGGGGSAAALAASRSTAIGGLVLLAMPSINGGDLMGLQALRLTQSMGLPAANANQILDLQSELLDVIDAGEDAATTEAKVRALLRRAMNRQFPETTKTGPQAAGRHALIEAVVSDQTAKVMEPGARFWLGYDPQPSLRKLRCPVLALYGEKDPFVPAIEDQTALQSIFQAGANLDRTIKTLPGLNHGFQTAKTGSPAEAGGLQETLAPVVLQTIGDWLKEHLKTARPAAAA